MSYARQAAMAGAVLLGVTLGVRAQDSSSETKKDDAPPAKTASPSDASSKSARSREQRPGQPGYRTGNDAPKSSDAAENETTQKNGKPKSGEGDEKASAQREAIEDRKSVV